MIIEPRIRGFVCTTAHPQGCEAHVAEQIRYVRDQGAIEGPKRVLVVGASTGYGLASRIVAAFGCGASTLGLFLERPGAAERCASAGWYNSAAFHKFAAQAGIEAHSINGDAFDPAVKEQTLECLRRSLGPVDLVVYSVAAPRCQDARSGKIYKSVLKPIGQGVRERTLDTDRRQIKTVQLEPATEEEIDATVKVMGGADWAAWLRLLQEEQLLAENFRSISYTYVGERITWPLYGDATIGAAKKDLLRTAEELDRRLPGKVEVAVLKALVTQASSAIPIMPLYLSLLFRVMKDRGVHEGCIEQISRLFAEGLYGTGLPRDADGRLRLDGRELDPAVQQEVERVWPQVNDENLNQLTDFQGYQEEFLRLFGFGLAGVDYNKDEDPQRPIPGCAESTAGS